MSRDDPQMKIRLPAALKASIEASAAANNRTLNAEIVSRLQATFDETVVTSFETKVRVGDEVSQPVDADAIAEKVARRIEVMVRGKPAVVELESPGPTPKQQPISRDVLAEKYYRPGESTLEELYARVYRALADVEAHSRLAPRGNEPYGPQKSPNARKSSPKK